MYASENNSWMISRSGTSTIVWTNGQMTGSGPPAGSTPDMTANWIAWQYVIDPYSGAASGFPKGDQNLTYSGIAKYLAIPYTQSSATPGSSGLPLSNDVNAQYAKVFTCPGDDVQQRPKTIIGLPPYKNYYYSYSLNDWVSLPVRAVVSGSPANVRSWGTFSGKISSIRNSADIVMFACEDSQTIDDGVLKLDASQWAGGVVNTVSTRHYGVNAATANASQGTTVNQDGYGNASFCDGHAEVISRKDVLRSRHSGNPNADPAGF